MAGDVLSLARLRGVPRTMLAVTIVASALAVAFGVVQGWPAWAIVAVALAPWVPVFGFEIGWTRRHYGWLALFYLLVVTQGGHVIEHIVQVTQIHVFGIAPKDAKGVFGALDIEWVHFVWNTWVLLAIAALVVRFRRNPWLLAAFAFALWHEAEHVYLIAKYIATGLPGNPGLGAMGGIVADGLPITRPDLHFYYNIVETTPLIIAFVYQLRRTHDAWLVRAFPTLAPEVLTRASRLARTRRFTAGQEIVREGDIARAAFVVARGEVDVVRAGTDRTIATLGPGQLFGEVGLLETGTRSASVSARGDVELLELDADTFRTLIEGSADAAGEVASLIRERSPER